jgi:2-C-methyl-D-erythritol 4-phosphate cytidylyltransferase
MRAAVVVLAAGAGTRVGAEVNKVLLPLDGVPVVARSIRTARAVPGVRRVVPVVREGEQEAVRAAVEPFLDPATGSGRREERPEVAMVTGGPTRHASEWQALSLLADDIEAGEIDVVAMHDAARPLASQELYLRVLAAVTEHGGAIPVAPLDHLVDLDGAGLPDRLVGVQTPQAFRAADLLAAHRAARADGFEATDTAGCLAAYGEVAVVAVGSDGGNLKLTVADDFVVAEALSGT